MLPINPLIPYHFVRAGWAFRRRYDDDFAFAGKDRELFPATRPHQDERARRIVAYAARHSHFYEKHWKGHDVRDWRNLPTVNKAIMMSHFDGFNTRGITREDAFGVALRAERERDFSPTLAGKITVGLSSGTSGHRGAFLVSPAETAAWAGTILQRVLHRLPRPGYRIAFFLRSNSNLYERIGGGRVRFRWFDLMTPILEAVAALNAYTPDLLVGPPSLLLALARMSDLGVLTIRPERLVSVAETLEPQDRLKLENTFGVPVGQVYQCTEGFIAATCPAGTLHINEDLVAVQYEPVEEIPPEGETKRVSPIITDLWRRTQPMIRYRLGDILTLGGDAPCPCGSDFQVIRAIEGRCDDVCSFPDVSTGSPRSFYPDTIRRMILLADESITDYAGVQRRCGDLTIHLAVSEGADFGGVKKAVEHSARAILAQYGCKAAQLEIVEGVPATPPGAKRRRVTVLPSG